MRLTTGLFAHDIGGVRVRVLEVFPADDGRAAMALTEDAMGTLRLTTLGSLTTDGFETVPADDPYFLERVP